MRQLTARRVTCAARAARAFALGGLRVQLPHELQAREDERRERVAQPLGPALAEVAARGEQHAVLALAAGTGQVLHQPRHQVLLLLKVLLIDALHAAPRVRKARQRTRGERAARTESGKASSSLMRSEMNSKSMSTWQPAAV